MFTKIQTPHSLTTNRIKDMLGISNLSNTLLKDN